MAKELIISCGRHETRVAVLEDDQLVEIYFQRANEYSLAGSIHKGRVTRVLPGMQSAFVDLGLERDTFLYVSDFFEEHEEFERVAESKGGDRSERPERSGGRGERGERGGRDRRGRGRDRDRREASAPAEAAPIETTAEAEETDLPAVEVETTASASSAELRRGSRRRRRTRGANGGNFPDSKFASNLDEPTEAEEEEITAEIESAIEQVEDPETPELPLLLPGESLSKYARTVATVEPEQAGEPEEEHHEDREPEHVDSGETHPSPVTPVHVLTHASLAAQKEAEVLEEVSAHLAEINKEKEEERDFEDAARLDHEEEEEEEDEAETEEEETGEESEEEPALAVALDAEADADALPTLETSEEDSDESPAAEAEEEATDDGVLPSLGYSAHLRQNDQRFLQQRVPGESGERSGRRRRRGRGRDRAAAAGETAEVSESPVEESLAVGEQAPVAVIAPQVEEPRRERDNDRDRDRGRDRGRGRDRERSSDRDRSSERERRPQPSITELLKEGQEILVQIAKEPLGQKGARITSHIALPGRYCVYMPTVEHTGVSRKIGSDEERQRLKRILQSRTDTIPGGFIIRTAGEGRAEEEILADMEFLHNLWVDIRKKAESKPAPALIYHDLEIVERVLRDQLGPEFKSIWVDSEEVYESCLRFLQRFQPMMVSRVRLYTRQISIFDNFGITQELEKALRPKVWLKSGGYIVINQTEALVAIDINTGKFVGKSNRLEDTIVKTNLEAVKEIVRQVRLRDLGGIIVIDFIDMDERKNRMRVMQALEEAMRADRAPYKILQFNDFGLVAVTRKRVKQSLERTLCSPCPYCEGSGYVKSVQTVITEILNEAKKLAPALEGSKDVLLRVNPEVAKVFKSASNQYLEELEQIIGRPVMIVSDGLIHQEKFDLA
jgi:ribonuclease G